MRIPAGLNVFAPRHWVAAVALLVLSSAGAQTALQRLDGEFVRRSSPDTPQVFNSNELVLEKEVGLRATGVTLKELISRGYRVVPSQIAGGPDWIDKATFDVSVIPHPGEDSREQAMQRFLKARFGLAVHTDTAPVFVLTVSDRGPKLAPTSLDPLRQSSLDDTPGKIVGRAATTKELAAALSRYLRRPVLDHTRLRGAYDFTVKWRLSRSLEAALAQGKGDPALAAALRSDLGLEMGSFPYESLIVDRAELPTGD